MKRPVLIILSVVVFVFILVGWWVWSYHGLNQYIKVLITINKLPPEQKMASKNNFLKNYDHYSYGGILAGVNTKLIPGIWVWGSKGIKFFHTDNYSVYSYFKVCSENSIQAFENNQKFVVNREIDTDLKVWSNKVKNGQYVFVTITKPENGGKLGNLREIRAHDWMAFMPTDIKKQCEK